MIAGHRVPDPGSQGLESRVPGHRLSDPDFRLCLFKHFKKYFSHIYVGSYKSAHRFPYCVFMFLFFLAERFVFFSLMPIISKIAILMNNYFVGITKSLNLQKENLKVKVMSIKR